MTYSQIISISIFSSFVKFEIGRPLFFLENILNISGKIFSQPNLQLSAIQHEKDVSRGRRYETSFLLPFMVLTINHGRKKIIQVMPAVFLPRSSNRPFSKKKDYKVQERILILGLSISIYPYGVIMRYFLYKKLYSTYCVGGQT